MPTVKIRAHFGNTVCARADLSLANDIVVHLRQDGYRCRVPIAAIDATSLLTLGVGAYLADRLVSRRVCAFDGWERDIRLTLPIADDLFQVLPMQEAAPILSFLTGDRWTISTNSARAVPDLVSGRRKSPSFPGWIVSLFSGGQDSLVGAINLLEAGQRVLLVGRCGFSSERGPQERLFDGLKRHYKDNVAYLSFNVTPRQDVTAGRHMETTFRSRSMLFLTFAAFVAIGVNASRQIVMPENGFIAQNLPIDSRRTGSLSTRTAHPFFLAHFNNFVSCIDGLSFCNPYEKLTKGELLRSCANLGLLQRLNRFCVSCGKTGRHRATIDRLAVHGNPSPNCGVCWPCIIRRSAERHAGIGGTSYSVPHPKRTIRSETTIRRFLEDFEMVATWHGQSPTERDEHQRLMSRLCGMGSLPIGWRIDDYVAVSHRGYAELRDWIRHCQ